MTDDSENNPFVFKQYEIMVNSAQQVTSWRQTTNGFYISLNTAIIALSAGFFSSPVQARAMLGLAGIAISIFWYWHVDYFAKLNEAKFTVIGEMEAHFPFKMFTDEYKYFNNLKCKKATQIEKSIAVVFCAIYLISLLVIFLDVV